MASTLTLNDGAVFSLSLVAHSAGALLAGLVQLAPFGKLSTGGFITMTDLSFAAQEVYDAFICTPIEFSDKKALAAALRAAALCCKRDQLQLLAIADELEGN